jgi:alcohol dehydrogenase, propanol-preferring
MTLGATPDPIEVSTSDLLFGSRSVEGALTGNPATGDATFKFSMLAGVAAMIETMLLEQAPQSLRQNDGWQGALLYGTPSGLSRW